MKSSWDSGFSRLLVWYHLGLLPSSAPKKVGHPQVQDPAQEKGKEKEKQSRASNFLTHHLSLYSISEHLVMKPCLAAKEAETCGFQLGSHVPRRKEGTGGQHLEDNRCSGRQSDFPGHLASELELKPSLPTLDPGLIFLHQSIFTMKRSETP